MGPMFPLAPTQAPGTAPSPRPSADQAAAAKAAEKFEAMFLSQVMQQMFAGIGTDGLFGGGPGEDMFRSLLIDEYGKELASRGGIGIADALRSTLLAAQEMGS